MAPPRPRAGIANIKPHMLPAGATLPTAAINLASNESAFGPGEAALAALREATAVERYAEDAAARLAQAIGERFDLPAGQIVVGHGSDDLLARLARAYLEPGSELIHSRNGYPKFPNYAYANDATPVAAPDDDLRASVDGILASVTPRTRAVFLANPDNPSGSFLPGEEVRRLHAGLPEEVLLVLDSAYAEYVDAPDHLPAEDLVRTAGNVVMTRTFSKVFGLAGLRLGWLFAPPAIADVIRRIGITFPLSLPAFAAAQAALEDRAHFARVVAENDRLRAWTTDRLTALGLQVYPSQGNFLLVRFPEAAGSAAEAETFLQARGIAVRRFGSPAYRDCIRVTIGLQAEMQALVDELDTFLKGAR